MGNLINDNRASILLGNGFNINFGGAAYTNQFIIKRIIFNARSNKYNPLFNDEISGEEIANIFSELATWTNDISAGKYDNIITGEDIPVLENFKKRYNWQLHHYYEVGLEDWFFILRVYFLKNDDLSDNWSSAKQGFEQMMLDAIYNEGQIQNLYLKMGKPVKRYFNQFDNIFTLNYDNNIDRLTGRNVFHLHGDYKTPANSENPNTLQGYIRAYKGQNVIIKGFEHCYCDALFGYNGNHKYAIATAFENGEKGLRELENNISETGNLPQNIKEIIRIHGEHPELTFGVEYHFKEFREIPNHTAGGTALLDRTNRILFSGDEIMRADSISLNCSVEQFEQNMEKLEAVRGEFDQCFGGPGIVDAGAIDHFLDCSRYILAGGAPDNAAGGNGQGGSGQWNHDQDTASDSGQTVYGRGSVRTPDKGPAADNTYQVKTTYSGCTLMYDSRKITNDAAAAL
jgi:hypothetical protein